MRRLLTSSVLVLACHAGTAKPTATPTTATAPTEPAFPVVGALAPAFTLATVHGGTITLDDALSRGPVVLVFGSFT